MIVEKEFDIDSRIELPHDIVQYSIGDWTLHLSPLNAIWFVTSKGFHADVFTLFQNGKTIKEIRKFYLTRRILKECEITEIIQDVLAEILDKTENNSVFKKYSTLKIFLTNKCNLKCIHCYRYKESYYNDELTTEDWEKLIIEHKKLGGESVLISGGEPLLEMDKLVSILNISKHNNLKTAIITNATLINKNFLNQTNDLLDEIQISLDGPEPISANLVRGEKNYQKVLEALQLLKKSKIKIFLAMTPIPKTLDAFTEHLPSFISFLNDKMGKERIVLKLTREILDGREIKKMTTIQKIEFESKIRAIENSIYGLEYNNIINSTFYEPGLKQKSCGIGLSLGIQPNGNIYACDLDSTIVANVKEKPLCEIFSILSEIESKYSVENFKPCMDCNLRYLCGGPCRMEIDENFHCSENYKSVILENLVGLNKHRYES